MASFPGEEANVAMYGLLVQWPPDTSVREKSNEHRSHRAHHHGMKQQ